MHGPRSVVFLFLLALLALWQPAARADGLISAEAFLDDLGLAPGTGTPLTLIGDAADVFRQATGAVELAGVAPGPHTVFLRFQDERGDWSAPLGQSFRVIAGNPSGSGGDNLIVAAEAFVDVDPGQGNGVPLDVARDGGIDDIAEVLAGQIPLAGLQPGRHVLHVRMLDATGNWSIANRQSFHLASATGTGNPVTLSAAEAIIDGGAPIALLAADGQFDDVVERVALSRTVGDGYHSVRVRFQDSDGFWSGTDGGCDGDINVSPVRREFGATGGQATLNVSAPGDCAWRAESGEGWITLLGGTSGQGDGSVSYRVAATDQSGARIGNVQIADAVHAIWQAGSGTGSTVGSLGGVVYHQDTGQPLAGAQVTLGGQQTTSAAGTGRYAFDAVPAGDYQLAASLTGYRSLSNPVTLSPLTSTVRDLPLQPQGSAAVPDLYAVSSRYDKQVYFLEGVGHAVDFTAHVDWAGQTPSRVRWLNDQGTLAETTTTTSTVTETLDIGANLSACEPLRAEAVSGEGATSTPRVADLTVMSNPYGVPLSRRDRGDEHVYQPTVDVNWDFFGGELAPGFDVPDRVPLFGGKKIDLDFIPRLEAELASDGTGYVQLEQPLRHLEDKWGRKDNAKKIMALLKDAIAKGKVDRRRLPKQYIAGLEFELFPYLRIDSRFDADACRWDYLDGSHLGLVAELTLKKTQQMVTPVGPVPVPWYLKASLTAELQTELAVLGLDGSGNWELASELTSEVSSKAAIGAGVDAVAAVEGWLSGGFRQGFHFQRDVTPLISEVTLGGGVSIYAWIFRYDFLDLEWTCDLLTGDCNGPGLDAPRLAEMAAEPRLIERDYLLAPNAGAFPGGVDVQRQARPLAIDNDGLDDGPLVETTIAAVQESVFPQSQATLSAAGDRLYAVWLYDDPARDAVNRTVAVFSPWQDDAFTTYMPIDDDGTADFHPRVVAFEDGAAAAVWEDVATALADDATPEQLAAALEISAAHYDAASDTWQSMRLTDDNTLDRSPRLAGTADDLWVVWIANATNDVRGSATAPNLLQARYWDGVDWGATQTLASVPHGIVNLELAYDGVDGVLALSVDTDGDSETVADHELFAAELTAGVWGALEQLTDDDVADDSPHLTPSAAGMRRLVWLRGDSLVEAPIANPASMTSIYDDAYSTNLAAFALAADDAGHLAVVWVEPDAFSADIFAVFYDPATAVWGEPRPLTGDEEVEQSVTAAFSGNALFALYDRTPFNVQLQTIPTSGGNVRAIPAPRLGLTDLYVTRHPLGGGVGIVDDSFTSFPSNPGPGDPAELELVLRNTGDTAQANIVVRFYLDDPDAGGQMIAETTVVGPLAPWAETLVSVPWMLPLTDAPLSLFAVVDPEAQLDDPDRGDNRAALTLALPNLRIDSVRWQWLDAGQTRVSLTARVTNAGEIGADATTLALHEGAADAPLLQGLSVPQLPANAAADIAALWDISALSGETYRLFLAVDEDDAVMESDELDNDASLLIGATAPQTLCGDADGSGSVNIVDALAIARSVAGLPPPPVVDAAAADVNGDGGVNIVDALLVARFVAGLAVNGTCLAP